VNGLTLTPGAVARDALRLRAAIRREGIHIVHAHHSHDHWLALIARPILGDRRRPHVVRTFHNLRAVKRDRLAAGLYRRTAAAFAVSRQIEARCREVGIPPGRVHWIPGSVALERFAAAADPRPVRDEFKIGDAPVIVSVARLAPNRGHDLLLAGFRLLLRELPAARLLLVGKGETRGYLERLVAELGLGDQVVFTGYRDRDLPLVLAAADCFALMSAGSDESCRAALEAMAAGRLVVARRVGALPETVVHGETGLLIDDDRPESVCAALAAALVAKLGEADLVHVHRGKEHWLAAAANRLSRTPRPIVRTRHIAHAVRAHAANRWLYRRATAWVVTVTDAIRGQYIASGLLEPGR